MTSPVPAPPAGASWPAGFETTRADVDRVLGEIPDNRLETRRVVTREWAFDPDPLELQAIVRIAHDAAARSGASRELARATLAARVLVERCVSKVLDSGRPDAERLGRMIELLPQAASAIEALEQRIRATDATLSGDERNLVSFVAENLLPSREMLLAAEALAPGLIRVAGLSGPQDARAALPALSEEELALLTDALWPERRAEDDARNPAGACWTCAEGILLAAAIREDLASRETTVDGPATSGALERDRVACRFVAARLRKRRDEAMRAGLRGYGDMLHGVQRLLSSTYRDLATVLDIESQEPAEATAEPTLLDTDLQRLLDESAARDAQADAQRRGGAAEEGLYLEALEGMRQGRTTPEPLFAPTYDPKRERLRIRILTSIAVLLLAGCVAAWATRFSGGTDPLAVNTEVISDSLILDEIFSVGPMLYAVVSHWSWDPMTDEERLSSTRALGLSAANQGYQAVYLVDEKRRELALWTANDGAELAGAPPPDDTPAQSGVTRKQ